MRAKLIGVIASGILAWTWGVDRASLAADAKAKVTFQDQVSAVFKNRCNSCHNADKQKGGLNLETFGGAMQGGGSGKVVEPGDVDGSTLFSLITHKEEPKMPPNSPKIPDAEIEVIKQWIEGGALEASGSLAMVKAKPKFEFKLDPNAAGKPVGPPAMPENLSTEPVVVAPRPNAVLAIASSPWAPLVAVAGHKQVLLYNTTNNHLAGVLPFPEGTIHVLKFSRNGGLLLAGGGRGGQSGLAVVWDVKTGKRAFEIGKEYDAVLAADISPDHGLVALGGPSKILRVYSTADGQLVYESKKHTEWVTAIEFSPDGVLLASGDRNNGLVVWEAHTGREYFDLRGHTLAITDLSWRLDSNVLASSSEDGTVRLWEMENGSQIKSWGAHGGGTASVRFAQDGRLVTTGRDRVARLWDQNGGKQRDFEPFNDLALDAVFTHDASEVIAGDWSGEVRAFGLAQGNRLANLSANPAPIATRLVQTTQALTAAEAESKKFAPLIAAGAEKGAALASAQAALAAAQAAVTQRTAESQKAAAALKQIEAAEQAVATANTQANQAAAAKSAAETAAIEKTSAEKGAVEATNALKANLTKLQADKAAEDKLVAEASTAAKSADKAAAEKGAADLAAHSTRASELKGLLESATALQLAAQGIADKTAAEKGVTLKAVETAKAQVVASTTALTAAQAAAQKATADKGAATKAFNDLDAALKAATALAATRKAEADQATAAKAAADKALADNKAAIDAATAKVQSLKAEADALALEKKASDAAKTAGTTTASQGG